MARQKITFFYHDNPSTFLNRKLPAFAWTVEVFFRMGRASSSPRARPSAAFSSSTQRGSSSSDETLTCEPYASATAQNFQRQCRCIFGKSMQVR